MPLSVADPDNYEALLDAKAERVSALLQPYCEIPPTVFPSQPTGFRMRAEFRMWHDGDDLDYVMFDPSDPKVPIVITDFPIATESITRLMPPLRESLARTSELRRRLFQVEFLATLSGEMLITLVYHRKLDSNWEDAANQLKDELANWAPQLHIVGRSRKQKVILSADYVNETLQVHGRHFHYVQFEQSFTQPNARVNQKMIEWACDAAINCSGDLLELYCGNGNFTLPLASHFDRVIATELSKVSARAALSNVDQNAIANIEVIRLSAEEVTQAMKGVREFRRLKHLPKPLAEYALNTLFVDPPRAGLDAQTVEMAAQFTQVLYVSCNPQTLAQNLSVLQRTHKVTASALFDQFPYTEHMECGVKLVRRDG